MTDFTSFNDDLDIIDDLHDECDRLSTIGFVFHVITTLMVIGVLIIVLVLIL